MIGVERFDKYDGCVKCHAKVVADEDDEEVGEVGDCVRCKTIQCISECDQVLTTQVMVKSGSGERISL